jgi:hypothetical protein
MENEKINILLFGDKRHRETRLRQSVVSIDDTDYLMEVRSARRCSIDLMTNDDINLSSRRSPNDWNRVWNDFSVSPENIRNMLPLNKGKNGGGKAGEEDTIATVDESSSSLKTDGTAPAEPRHPSWYNRLGAISRWEHRQEKAYHDTLDKRHEASTIQALKQNQKHPYYKFWHRRNSSRDGLDFSRDLALAQRHNSIYAVAGSSTQLPAPDVLNTNSDNSNDDNNESENDDSNNGYFQGARPVSNPKTTKCVLDLIA